MHIEYDIVMCLCVFNGLVDGHFDDVIRVYGVDQGNFEGGMLLEFCLQK